MADSSRAQLLIKYSAAGLPTYYLPDEDVRPGALVDETSGPGGQRTWAVRAGRKRAEGAAWTHENPTGAMAALAGQVTFSWRQLEWYEEDERVVMHARDPYRYYLPFEDVRTELLEASDTVTVCPYKGQARYWSAHPGPVPPKALDTAPIGRGLPGLIPPS